MALHDRRIQGGEGMMHVLGRRHHSAAPPAMGHPHPRSTSLRRRALRRSKGEFRLVFYPGANLLVVIRKSTGKEEQTFEAMGGFPDRRNLHDGHKVVHTPPGHYLLGKGQPHVTEAWWSSMIPWGAEITLDSHKEIVWTFKDKDGKIVSHGEVSRNKKLIHGIYKWGQIPGNIGTRVPHWNLEEAYKRLVNTLVEFNKDAAGRVTAKIRDSERTWKHNDFGPRSYHLTQVTEPGHAGTDQGIYIHTTAENEWATDLAKKENKNEKPELIYSHGCIHVRPVARQKMEDGGVLQEGTYLEVKSYHARYKPAHVPEM